MPIDNFPETKNQKDPKKTKKSQKNQKNQKTQKNLCQIWDLRVAFGFFWDCYPPN